MLHQTSVHGKILATSILEVPGLLKITNTHSRVHIVEKGVKHNKMWITLLGIIPVDRKAFLLLQAFSSGFFDLEYKLLK